MPPAQQLGQFQRQRAFQTDEQPPVRHAVNRLAREREVFHRRGERVATFEQNLGKDVVIRATVADMINVQIEWFGERLRITRSIGIPRCEVGLGQLENAKALIVVRTFVEIEFPLTLLVNFLDHAANALFADVRNG
jgi:hypothetical protein